MPITSKRRPAEWKTEARASITAGEALTWERPTPCHGHTSSFQDALQDRGRRSCRVDVSRSLGSAIAAGEIPGCGEARCQHA